MAKVAYITDLAAMGSGYMSLSVPICLKMMEHGHDVKAIGFGNHGEEHPFPFTIYPADDMYGVMQTAQLLYVAWQFDVLIVAMDIPIQEAIIGAMVNRPFKYVGIFPVEADPVCFSWSVVLSQMDKPFIISEFGTHEAHKRYIDAAEHIPIGIDSNFWHPATSEEKRSFRESFGIGEDEFVVLTVADNQERKNLAANFRAFATFAKEHPKSRYILVTRENSQVGWKLRDLALDPFGIGDRESTDAGYNISDKLMIFERGMPVTNLWQLYAVSDVFLLLSKAEGLGLPIMESMACGIPVIGTNCTGISELIGPDNLRGFSVGIEYIHIDPFGNGRRYHANSDDAAKILEYIYQNHPIDPNGILPQVIDNARGFIETRTWDKTIEPLLSYLESVDNEKKENTSEESPNE